MHGKIKIKWEIVITIIISIIGLYVSWQMYNIAKLQTTADTGKSLMHFFEALQGFSV